MAIKHTLYTNSNANIPTVRVGSLKSSKSDTSPVDTLAPWQKMRDFEREGRRFILLTPTKDGMDRKEHMRKMGAEVWQFMMAQNLNQVQVDWANKEEMLAFGEGMALKDYRFEKYKKDKSPFELNQILYPASTITQADLTLLGAKMEAICHARDLVNEPANILTAEELSSRITELGGRYGFTNEVFAKIQLQALKMGGILAVNQGSTKEPRFNILEYKPEGYKNKRPVVLIGKGITYDTGGLSIKSTLNSMDMMKCDMAGAAAVIGAFCAVAAARVPVHIVGLIPATDNQPGPDAFAPGDVITMHDGTTVEVMNTDAEGRLILADALAYAKKFDPELVIDFATLTGSAVHALGQKCAAAMGTASDVVFEAFTKSGFASWERIVRLPLWEDFGIDLESDIADVKNLGASPTSGAIVAGKFLERFTDYPWIHVDIAGPAFLSSSSGYLPKGGTGYGVHLAFNYLIDYTA
jgi:leucyl aminopeptidase